MPKIFSAAASKCGVVSVTCWQRGLLAISPQKARPPGLCALFVARRHIRCAAENSPLHPCVLAF